MEGKAVLFKRFADIDVYDLEVDSEDPDDVIRFCELLEPTVGGINLEDIKAPECFYIEQTLRDRLDIPVFHDDQHGTAIIGAPRSSTPSRSPADIGDDQGGVQRGRCRRDRHRPVLPVARGRPENLLMLDSRGVIHPSATTSPGSSSSSCARPTPARSGCPGRRRRLRRCLGGGDRRPGDGAVDGRPPIVFALANPDPRSPTTMPRPPVRT
jgi:malate dehydrogenase (oxaloacetate-decarboxylating)(NADP+)